MSTRRQLLLSLPAAGLALRSAAKESLVYVGTYTRGGSKGIYVYRFDQGTGKLAEIGVAAETPNPSFLAIHPNGKLLYAVNELSKFHDQPSGSVTAYEMDRTTGKLKMLNDAATGGTSPCHLVVDRTQRNLLLVNYGTGSTAVFRLKPDGSLGERSGFVQHTGSSVDERRQKGPHAHSVNLSKNERFAIVADLGTDEFIVYAFDAGAGTIARHGAAKVKPGSGPRHFHFHPTYKFAYGLNEMGSSVSAFQWDEAKGTLTEIQNITTLPAGFSGTNHCAEILVHPNGRFVYASNRGHNSLAAFAIDKAKGTLTSLGNTSTQGQTPRNFRIDPTGTWLIAANQDSGNVFVYRIDTGTGKLAPTGQEVAVPFPVCVKFVA
jgi:6-phosphogluconolactonase